MSLFIEAQVKSALGSRFFDRRSVINKIGKINADALRRVGLNIRKIARQSIRKAGKRTRTSVPGQPPRSHKGWLKRSIFAEWDDSRHAAVIGPRRVTGTSQKAVPISGKRTVPQTLEVAGVVRFFVPPNQRALFKGNIPPDPTGHGVFVKRRVAKRPYMRPALKKAIKLPALKAAWNQIRRNP